VFRAHDTARDRAVAFKKLSLPPGPEAFQALQHEVAALCRAQVPGVARIIACGTAEDGIAYIVQELVSGKNLRNALPSDMTARLQLLTQLATTLDTLHGKDLVHGDIKPENVIVASDGKPVLVDFSAARFAGKQDSQNAATRAYLPNGWRAGFMSPMMRDQYAFGLMLLEALTDTGPLERGDLGALIKRTAPNSKSVLNALLQPWPFGKVTPLQARMEKLLK
jgi:serine/threonine protein kinase